MKYPRLPEELDKRRKLTTDDIEEIRRIYKQGSETHRSLAKSFGVSKTIIRYYLIDAEKRKEINKKRYARLFEVMLFDDEKREKHIKGIKKAYKEGYQKYDLRRIYKGKQTYKWKKKKYHTDEEFRNKTREQAREPNRILFNKKYQTIPVFREYVNEKNKQNYIKRLLSPPHPKKV